MHGLKGMDLSLLINHRRVLGVARGKPIRVSSPIPFNIQERCHIGELLVWWRIYQDWSRDYIDSFNDHYFDRLILIHSDTSLWLLFNMLMYIIMQIHIVVLLLVMFCMFVCWCTPVCITGTVSAHCTPAYTGAYWTLDDGRLITVTYAPVTLDLFFLVSSVIAFLCLKIATRHQCAWPHLI